MVCYAHQNGKVIHFAHIKYTFNNIKQIIFFFYNNNNNLQHK